MPSSYAIILGGGIGSRMASPVPKQLLILKGLPVIMHSMKAFYDYSQHTRIVLVLHADYLDYWRETCREYDFSIPHTVIAGGTTRFHSVLNGLQYIWKSESGGKGDDAGADVIAIHDGVRPLVSQVLIDRAYRAASEQGTAVPAVRSSDSVRMVDTNGISRAIDRDKIALVQTPQTFQSSILRRAYGQGFDPCFTDDASVVEKSGYPIQVIEGDIRNIKVTYPVDLVLADKLIELA